MLTVLFPDFLVLKELVVLFLQPLVVLLLLVLQLLRIRFPATFNSHLHFEVPANTECIFP